VREIGEAYGYVVVAIETNGLDASTLVEFYNPEKLFTELEVTKVVHQKRLAKAFRSFKEKGEAENATRQLEEEAQVETDSEVEEEKEIQSLVI